MEMVSTMSRTSDYGWDRMDAEAKALSLRRRSRRDHTSKFMIKDILEDNLSSTEKATTTRFAVADILRLPEKDAASNDPETTTAASSAVTSASPIATSPPPRLPPLPAWIFCTRYSDRPSSGERD